MNREKLIFQDMTPYFAELYNVGDHMNKSTAIGALGLCIIILSGCTVRSLKTSGEIAPERQMAAVKVNLDWTLPKTIQITRQARGYMPTVTESDKIIARNNAAQLIHLFGDGFKYRFPPMASKYGLEVANPPEDALKLKISVTSLKMSCSGLGCASTLFLKGELLDASATTLWQFSSEVGQPIVNAAISDELFDSFATALLEAMKKDRIIAEK